MKKLLLLFFFFNCAWCIFNSALAQNPLVKQWDYRFGGTGVDYLLAFQQTADGGYILGGFSDSDSSGDKTQSTWGVVDYWIVKTDSFGNKQWDKDFGGENSDLVFSIKQTSDGGYILGGSSNSGIWGDKTQPTWGSSDYWIVKIDSLGNKQWDKDFGGADDDALYSLQQTIDGGYILGGWSSSGISGDKTQASWGGYDYWIIKTDSLGNKQWDKDFGGLGIEKLYSLQQTVDDGFILGGSSGSGISGDKTQFSQGGPDYWIIKIDDHGNKQWDKAFGGISYDWLYSLQQTDDGGYLLGGYSYSGISGDKTEANWDTIIPLTADFWIVKTDSIGSKQWDRDFGGTSNEDEFGNIFQAADGGYLISGTSYSPISGNKTENNLGPEQTWLVKTDSLGNIQWDKTLQTISSAHDETGLSIQSKDGCYVMANFTYGGVGGDKTQPSWGNSDYWIIKFCDSTLTTSIIQFTNTQLPFSIYPNPASDLVNISYSSSNKTTTLILFDIYGQKLKTLYTGKPSVSKQEQTFSLKDYPAGIYVVKLNVDGKEEIKKVVKL